MRRLAAVLFISLLIQTGVAADEAAYGPQLSRHLAENSRAFPKELKDLSAEVDVVLTIDRDGKLMGAEITHSSASAADNENVLTGLRSMSPFPRVPDDVRVPFRARLPLEFIPRARIVVPDLKWSMTPHTSGQEISFRVEVLRTLQAHPRILPQKMKSNDVHSVIEVSIDRDGKIADAKIAKSFGLKTVDDGTLVWLRTLQPFPKPPSEMKVPTKLTVELVFGPKSYDEEARRRVGGVCRGC